MPDHNSKWTPELIEVLSEHWVRGDKADLITMVVNWRAGVELFTTQATLGKANRLCRQGLLPPHPSRDPVLIALRAVTRELNRTLRLCRSISLRRPKAKRPKPPPNSSGDEARPHPAPPPIPMPPPPMPLPEPPPIPAVLDEVAAEPLEVHQPAELHPEMIWLDTLSRRMPSLSALSRYDRCCFPCGERPDYQFCEWRALPGKSWCAVHYRRVFVLRHHEAAAAA